MCLATPVKVKSQISKSKFQIDDDRVVDTSLVPDVKIGNWLLCHADLAINKINKKEAEEILKLNKMCHHNEVNNVSHHSGSSSQS